MITEDYVSFETAKLLKEKGFDVWGDGSYDSGIEIYKEYSPSGLLNSCATSKPHPKGYPAPTLQMTMKWLREKYNLEIYPYHQNSETYHTWWFEIINYPSTVSEYESNSIYTTYEQACESAIRYCLENLI